MTTSYLRLTAFLLLVATSSHGADGTWANDAGNGNANWTEGTNWVSGIIPGSSDLTISSTDIANFNAAPTVETPLLDGNRRLDRVFIDNAQADYSILSSAPGNVLYLQRATVTGNALAVVGSGSTTINPEVRIGTSTQAWNTGTIPTGNAAVTLAGGLSLTQATTVLTLVNLTPVVVQGSLYRYSGTGPVAGTLEFAGDGSIDIAASIHSGILLNGPAGYTGTLRLSGNNAITGNLIFRTGSLELNNSGALGSSALQLGTSTASSAAVSAVTLIPMTVSAAFQISSGSRNASITLGGAHTSGTTIFSNTLTLLAPGAGFGGFRVTAAGGGQVDFQANIAGTSTVPISKIGNGVVRFTNATGNTYQGTTTVSAGTLLVNNTSSSGTGSGTVTVNNSGTLGGTGSVSGSVSVNTGGTIAPGDSTLAPNAGAGIFTVGGALALAANSNVAFEINGTTAGNGAGFYDQILASNSVTLSGNVNFTLTLGIDPLDNGTQIFTLLNKVPAGAIAGSGLFNLNGTTLLAQGDTFTVGGQVFQISYTAGNTPGTFLTGGNDIALLAIPEPGTAAILTLGLVTLASSRRRR